MKSRIRSRSVSTSGLGLKSTTASSPRYSGAATLPRPPVAGEELAILLQQPGELQWHHLGQLTLDDPGRRPAGELRRGGQEELVDQIGSLHLGVNAWAALAEQRPDTVLLAQYAQCLADVDRSSLVADDAQRGRGLRRLGVRAGEDQDAAAAVGEERRVPGEVEPAADDNHQRLGAEAKALAELALFLARDGGSVALGAHRAGADHQRVETGPQAGEHRRVGLGADRPRDAADRRPPVHRGD